jgi:hypothetical protein
VLWLLLKKGVVHQLLLLLKLLLKVKLLLELKLRGWLLILLLREKWMRRECILDEGHLGLEVALLLLLRQLLLL